MEWKMIFNGILSDAWILWVWHNYSILFFMIPSIVAGLLKIIAIRHPEVPTDAIMDLVKVLFTKPGTESQDEIEKKEE